MRLFLLNSIDKSQWETVTLESHISFHLFIFYLLIQLRSAVTTEQNRPDTLLFSHTLQRLLGYSQPFSGQLQDVLSPECPESALESLPTQLHPQHCQRETAGSHTYYLIWLLSLQRCSGSKPNRGGLITSQPKLKA